MVRRYLTRMGKVRLSANRARFQIAQEAMGGIKEVKILGLEEAYLARFRIPSLEMARSSTGVQIVGELPRHLLEAVAFGGVIALVIVLLLREGSNLAAVLPVLGVFAFAGLRMFPSVQQIYHSLIQLRSSDPVLEAIHRDMHEVNSIPRPSRDAAGRIRLDRGLSLDDVHYSYPNAERASLKGLTLSIDARTTVGIVGGTGAGKTTAVDIILGLLEPQRGSLRVDGEIIGPKNLRSWQNILGYVPQQIFLTDDSVAANIAFGIVPDRIDMAAVERAARVANLHEFVTNELPQAYQTFVGERGVRLSGGQRQRIGIARALYHDPDVLILDEATSALDNLTEKAVIDAVHNLAQEKTIIMIAHRLTTVRDCDTIFLLENGRLVAQGSYQELLANNASFRQLATADTAVS
jgi:ABC-type multidrug transport system fused ATPase/permease subunit